jgi:GNAT superfamily N-acetyltransferase
MSGPSAITVRSASAADNDALNALVRRCPMRADISLIVERDPDFFALSRARGRTSTFLAEIDGAVVGCISSWRHSAWLGGTPGDICYIGDLRIAPEQRRRGIATQLVSNLDKFLDTLPQVPFLLATGAGNSAVERLTSGFGTGGEPLARIMSWQLLPVVALKISAGLDMGAAEPRDEGELALFLDEFHQRRHCSPIFSGGGLGQLLDRCPGAQLSDYLIARRHGRIVAALGLWDASSVRGTRVVGMPLWMRSLCAAARAVSRITALPPFPQVGTLLRFRYIRHPAFADGHEDSLNSLVRRTVNEARARREHFVLYTCADNDPLCSGVGGLPRLSFRYNLSAADSVTNIALRDVNFSKPAWFFEDAALA